MLCGLIKIRGPVQRKTGKRTAGKLPPFDLLEYIGQTALRKDHRSSLFAVIQSASETQHFRNQRNADDRTIKMSATGDLSKKLLTVLFRMFVSELLGYSVETSEEFDLDLQSSPYLSDTFRLHETGDFDKFEVGYNGQRGVYFADVPLSLCSPLQPNTAAAVFQLSCGERHRHNILSSHTHVSSAPTRPRAQCGMIHRRRARLCHNACRARRQIGGAASLPSSTMK